MCLSCTHTKPIRVFVVIPLSFTFPAEEEVSGFSVPAWVPRQREFLASLNPRLIDFLFHWKVSFLRVDSATFVAGIIDHEWSSDETPVGCSMINRNMATSPQSNSRKRNLRDYSSRSVNVTRLPRGSVSTEHSDRGSHRDRVTGTIPARGLPSWCMRIISQPGVLETLNPTEDGSFGKSRNTYETKL
jgi:hypothetical protein